MYYTIRVNKRVKQKILGGKQVFTINEIKKVEIPAGSIVKLTYSDKFVAWATINPKNPKHYIRILSLEENLDLQEEIIKKLKKAKKYREKIGYFKHYRWIYSESDFISGVIIDKYNDIAVIQNENPFFDRNIDLLVNAIKEVDPEIKTIYEKSIGKNREKEYLSPIERLLYGEKIETVIEEYGKKFIVNVQKGQKTGWFLDQRENRNIVKKLAYGKILDVFSYTGSFGIISSKNAEEIVFIEKNKTAVEILKRNLELNNVNNAKIIKDNAYHALYDLYLQKAKFDTIILDPPDLLSEGYKKGLKSFTLIAAMALDLIEEGNLIVFSCSQDLKENKMFSILRTLIRRKGKRFELLTRFHQALDHKVIYPHKELEYLKGFAFYIF